MSLPVDAATALETFQAFGSWLTYWRGDDAAGFQRVIAVRLFQHGLQQAGTQLQHGRQ